MTRKLFTNARLVTETEVFLGTLELHAGRIVRIELGATNVPGAEDCGGEFILPGLIDLRAAGWLNRLRPGRDALRSAAHALVAQDLESAACGITTCLDRVSAIGTWPAEILVDTLRGAKASGVLRADHWIHAEAEGSGADDAWITASPLVRAIGVALAEQGTAFRESTETGPMPVFQPCPASPAAVSQAALFGTTATLRSPSEAAAAEAATSGIARAEVAAEVLNAAAGPPASRLAALGRRKLLDILVSERAPSALLAAAFALRDHLGWTLPQAVAAISSRPAALSGFSDRGLLATGSRGDFFRVRETAWGPVPCGTWRAGERIA